MCKQHALMNGSDWTMLTEFKHLCVLTVKDGLSVMFSTKALSAAKNATMNESRRRIV
jgi:hypothetical protein